MNYENRTFKGGTHVLDGNVYDSCSFDGVSIFYEGGNLPEFRGAMAFENSTFVFGGAALRTMGFMTFLYSAGAVEIVEQMFTAIREGKSNG